MSITDKPYFQHMMKKAKQRQETKAQLYDNIVNGTTIVMPIDKEHAKRMIATAQQFLAKQ